MHLPPNWLKPDAGAYLVGGCVRDLILGRMPCDYDVVILGDAEGYARSLAAALGVRIVAIGKPAFRVWRLVADRLVVDVAAAAGGSIANDLRRRDFTINALAIHSASGAVVDVSGGIEDLAARTIRMASAAAFRTDPLRLLRAFRLASQLGFAIDPHTGAAICREAHLIGASAGERIREELFKLLAATAAYAQVADMRQAGLLQAIFPEREPALIEPSLQILRALEAILEGFSALPPDLAARLTEEFPERRRVLLKCAALLQPPARPRKPAADRLPAALNRLRLSKKDAARLAALIRPNAFANECVARPAVSASAEVHFFRSAGDLTPDFLILALAARTAGAVLPAKPPQSGTASIVPLLRNYFFRHRPRLLAAPPLRGEDLIREFGLRPSPRFKQILDHIDHERLLRESFTRAEALELVRAYLDAQA
jgi:tRNA nucleotidyltransferase/poly(A) polymerase